MTPSNAGAACQVEKVDHATALQMTKTLGSIKQVGTSLGSFSLTAALLSALLNEFSSELDTKKGQLDSDPHWWMPMWKSKFNLCFNLGSLVVCVRCCSLDTVECIPRRSCPSLS